MQTIQHQMQGEEDEEGKTMPEKTTKGTVLGLGTTGTAEDLYPVTRMANDENAAM